MCIEDHNIVDWRLQIADFIEQFHFPLKRKLMNF